MTGKRRKVLSETGTDMGLANLADRRVVLIRKLLQDSDLRRRVIIFIDSGLFGPRFTYVIRVGCDSAGAMSATDPKGAVKGGPVDQSGVRGDDTWLRLSVAMESAAFDHQ